MKTQDVFYSITVWVSDLCPVIEETTIMYNEYLKYVRNGGSCYESYCHVVRGLKEID